MLKQYIEEYKEITIRIIQALENFRLDEANKYIIKRQEIIKTIDNQNYTQQEFKQISQELKLVELEKQLNDLLNTRKNYAKQKILSFKKSTTAFKTYNNNISRREQFIKKNV